MLKGEKASLISPLRILTAITAAALILLNLATMPWSAVAAPSAQITLSPNSGYFDTNLQIHGSNFAANTNITIKWQTLSYWKLFVLANSLGVFDVSLNVPDGLMAGSYVVTAVDESGNTASASFTLYFAYVDAGAFGLKTPKLNVQWKYDNDEFYCNVWQYYHDSYGGWYNIMDNDYGIYILRLTYNGTTYVFDLAGGSFDAWPRALVQRTGSFIARDFNHVQGTTRIYDPSGSILLMTISIDIFTPVTTENYYSVVFNMTAETRLDDVAFYLTHNLDVYGNRPNWAYYEQNLDAVYQYYGPRHYGSDIPEQYAAYAGFASVTPASTHHDVAIYFSELQYVATSFRDYNFNYRDRIEAASDTYGDCGVGLQWSIGTINTRNTVTIPVAFAASDTKLDVFKASLTEAKLNAYQFLSRTPALTLGANQAPGSAVIGANGVGFIPYSQVDLRFAGVSIASFNADQNGAFQGNFIVPTSVTGVYGIKATDSYGLEATANFQVVELTLQWVLDKLDQLNATVTGLVRDVDGSLSVLINTANGNIMAKLDEINATLINLSAGTNGEVLATINTAIGTITTRLTEIDAHIVGIVTSASDGILARIESRAGDILVKLDTLNATIAGLIRDSNGDLSLLINTASGNVMAKLSDTNATLVDVKGNVATIGTDLGTIKTSLASINGTITLIEGRTATIQTDVGKVKTDINNTIQYLQSINAQLQFVNATTLRIDSQVGSLNVTVTDINKFLVEIEAKISTVENTTIGAYLALDTELGKIELQLNLLNATLVAIKGDSAEVLVRIGQSTNTVFAELSSLKANITDIKLDTATIQTSIGTITTSIDNIRSEIIGVKGDIITIKTNIGQIQVNISDINAKITLLNENYAAIETSLGVLMGNVTSINGEFVTIKTELGTLTANLRPMRSEIIQPSTILALVEIAVISAVVYSVYIIRSRHKRLKSVISV